MRSLTFLLLLIFVITTYSQELPLFRNMPFGLSMEQVKSRETLSLQQTSTSNAEVLFNGAENHFITYNFIDNKLVSGNILRIFNDIDQGIKSIKKWITDLQTKYGKCDDKIITINGMDNRFKNSELFGLIRNMNKSKGELYYKWKYDNGDLMLLIYSDNGELNVCQMHSLYEIWKKK